jgi:hypothetical protein
MDSGHDACGPSPAPAVPASRAVRACWPGLGAARRAELAAALDLRAEWLRRAVQAAAAGLPLAAVDRPALPDAAMHDPLFALYYALGCIAQDRPLLLAAGTCGLLYWLAAAAVAAIRSTF